METQKIMNLLNDSSSEDFLICYKKWYVIDNQTVKDKYNLNSSIKFETESIKSSLCDYSDAFILVTGDITETANNSTKIQYLKTVHHFLHS